MSPHNKLTELSRRPFSQRRKLRLEKVKYRAEIRPGLTLQPAPSRPPLLPRGGPSTSPRGRGNNSVSPPPPPTRPHTFRGRRCSLALPGTHPAPWNTARAAPPPPRERTDALHMFSVPVPWGAPSSAALKRLRDRALLSLVRAAVGCTSYVFTGIQGMHKAWPCGLVTASHLLQPLKRGHALSNRNRPNPLLLGHQ